MASPHLRSADSHRLVLIRGDTRGGSPVSATPLVSAGALLDTPHPLMRRDPPPLCMLPARPLGPPRHRRHVHAHPADPPAAGAGSDAVGGFADGILDDDDLDDDGDDDVDDDRQDDQDHPSDSDAPHDPYGDEAPRSARSSASYHQHHHHHHPSHPGDHAVPTDRDRVSNKTDRPRGKALLDYPEPAVTMMNAAEHWQSHAPPESHECRFHIRGLVTACPSDDHAGRVRPCGDSAPEARNDGRSRGRAASRAKRRAEDATAAASVSPARPPLDAPPVASPRHASRAALAAAATTGMLVMEADAAPEAASDRREDAREHDPAAARRRDGDGPMSPTGQGAAVDARVAADAPVIAVASYPARPGAAASPYKHAPAYTLAVASLVTGKGVLVSPRRGGGVGDAPSPVAASAEPSCAPRRVCFAATPVTAEWETWSVDEYNRTACPLAQVTRSDLFALMTYRLEMRRETRLATAAAEAARQHAAELSPKRTETADLLGAPRWPSAFDASSDAMADPRPPRALPMPGACGTAPQA